MKNLIYILYFIKTTDWKKFKSHLNYIAKKFNISKCKLIFDTIKCSLIYGTSFHEYFYYGFYEKPAKLRAEYASMGFMYEFQKKNNPPQKRTVLSDKIKFFNAYSEFLGRKWINPLTSSLENISSFSKNLDKIVLKKSTGGGGKNVRIIELKDYSSEQIKQLAESHHFDIIEEFVEQHPDLQLLAPNSLNTIRFITQLCNDGSVSIIGASLRMGISKNTDNLSSGGIAAKINIDSGIIDSDGVSFDITIPKYKVHPISGVTIKGFKIPFWNDVIILCKKAALKFNDNKSIGWDVAIKQNGPILIEGNHDWGARVWQMPAGTGLKATLSKYMQ